MEATRNERRGVRKATTTEPFVRTSDDGFVVVGASGEVLQSIRWADIAEVVAYKRDLLTMDLICAAFSTAAGVLELNEEVQGWDDVMAALPVQLPGARPFAGAFLDIVVPAFAANTTTLFKRAV